MPAGRSDAELAGWARITSPMKRLGSKARSALTADWWLTAIFVGCSVFAAVLVCRAREWSVMTDELLYTEMARGMLETGLPLPSVRGEFVQVYQVLYPLMIAPLIWIVGMPEAYQAIAAANAVALTSACIPAYLLTLYITDDKVLGRWVALCVGVLPWIALATKILTDSLAFPVFVWAVYAIVLAVAETERSRRRDWIALAAITLAYLARSQFVVLPAVFCAAILARELTAGIGLADGSPGRRVAAGLRAMLQAPLRRLPVFAFASVVVLLALFKPEWILGVYSATTSDEFGAVLPSETLAQMSSHLGMISLGIGLLPLLLTASWICSALVRPHDERQNSAAITFAITTLVLLFVAASFDIRFSKSAAVYERYIFYLAPVLLIGAAALVKSPPRSIAALLAPALVALVAFVRDDHFGLDDPLVISLSHSFKPVAIFEIALQRVVDASGVLPSVTIAMTLASAILAGVVFTLVARKQQHQASNVAFGFVAAYCLWATVFIVPKVVEQQNSDVDSILGQRNADMKTWIDAEAGERRVSLVYGPINYLDERPTASPGTAKAVFWDAELWNASILSYYTPLADRGSEKPTMSPYHRLRVRFADGSIQLTGGKPAPLWLMSSSDPRFAPLTSVPAVHNHSAGLTVFPVTASPRADWATRGLTYQGFVPAQGTAELRVYSGAAAPGSAEAPDGAQQQGRAQQQGDAEVPGGAEQQGGAQVRGAERQGGAQVRGAEQHGGVGSASRLVSVRLKFERRRRRSPATGDTLDGGTRTSNVFTRERALCLPATGHRSLDLRGLTDDLTGANHSARLLETRVTRTHRPC